MAIYKTTDLFNFFSDAIADGFEYVEIDELETKEDDEEDFSASLVIDCIMDSHSSEQGVIDSVELPSTYSTYVKCSEPEDTAPCLFTYEQLAFIDDALHNSIQQAEAYKKSPSCTRETKENIRISTTAWRNLQAKLAKILKDVYE